MNLKKVGSRGTLFTFYDLGIATNVYVINGNNYVYIIDTYIGPDIMKVINKYIEEEYGNKPIVVVNTHNHWDHVWGNSLFSSSIILAHKKCKEYMQLDGLKKLKMYEKYRRGEVILTYPNTTFTDKIYFEEDNILIYHTPGHTDDSITVLDMKDKVLLVGDNLERPIPYIMSKDLRQYVDTLKDYLNTDAYIIIGGHTACEDKSLIEHNLNYLQRVLSGEIIKIESKEFEDYHKTNMDWLKNALCEKI